MIKKKQFKFSRVLLVFLLVLFSISLSCKTTILAKTADKSEPFTLIVLPDTQMYSWNYRETFYKQTQWIAKNIDALNIAFVLHEGDLVQHPTNEDQWQVAVKAFESIDGKVPYCVVPGNHDGNRRAGFEMFQKFMPVSRFDSQPSFGGNKDPDMQNSYHFFSASGMDFMIICLPYQPKTDSIKWADEIAKKHKDRRTIVITHSYLEENDKRNSEGNAIWSGLAKKNENIFLVLCGHKHYSDGVGQSMSKNDAGNDVHELLACYQSYPNGGNGWLRIMTFMPKENKIKVSTYSPSQAKYSDKGHDKFELEYDMN